jgi:acyl transferase domain-containing protein/4'-phosphopantetheinyl transferase EntD
MSSAENRNPGKIAIVGMSCLFPGAPDLASFWSNIVGGVDAIREVSENEWNVDDYYDPDARAFGKTYSKRGGFISEIADFDPLKYGVMPSGVAGGDPDQFLTLRVAYEAMADAGYLNRPFDKERAEIILGRISAPGAGSMNLVHQSKTVHEISALLHGLLPDQGNVVDAAIAQMKDRLVVCNSDTIPGAMPNVLAGRIAAKLGFRGRSLLVDAACASSMVAVETAVDDLLSNRCDFALAGGLHVNASPVFFQMFCGLGALSREDVIRPFDENADGTLLGEGIGIICLKRHEDAIADGDRIYATICGVASSSDGHGGSVLSPSADGEALAMEKAYRMAGVSPKSIGLLEAHGTGTPTGDVVELQAVEKVFGSLDPAHGDKPWCAVGSVKSMIGHCQSASAVAGIIKAALALHHKIIPPTLHVSQPNKKIDWSKHPCYVNTQSRPWIHPENAETARRAAVSAFGFGGINGHLVMEEAEKGSSLARHMNASKPAEEQASALPTASLASMDTALMRNWESEVFTFTSEKVETLKDDLRTLRDFVLQSIHTEVSDGFLKDLAYSVNCGDSPVSPGDAPLNGGRASTRKTGEASAASSKHRLAIVAANPDDLVKKLEHSIGLLEQAKPSKSAAHETDKGVYYTSPGTILGGKVGFLYPGLGSAYTGMLSDLCLHFPEVREVFDIVDTVALAENATVLPSKMIFPPSAGSKPASTESLASADFAVVAVLLAEYALHQLLLHLEIQPDALMGCSTGEFAAITTGGAVDVLSVAETFYGLSTKVARAIPEDALAKLRSLRILASAKDVMALVKGKDVHLSADLGERHIIVTGTTDDINALSEKLSKNKIVFQTLPIAIPYHTPLVKDLIDENHNAVKSVDIHPLAVQSWACSTGVPYPDDSEELRAMFTDLFTKPIRLRETILSMYEHGVRNFVEVGPNAVLTSVVASILLGKPHVAVATNLASRPALTQLHHVLAALYSQGVSANFKYLYIRRAPAILDWRSKQPRKAKREVLKLSLCHTKLEISPELSEAVRSEAANAAASRSETIEFTTESGAETFSRANSHGQPETADVLGSFMNTNATFYSRMAAAQERIMTAFLSGHMDDSVEASEPVELHSLRFDAPQSTQHQFVGTDDSQPAFINRFRIQSSGDTTEFDLRVDLDTDLYLLDHAVGGQVSASPAARVFLMPLMVSLEIMAEAAFVHAHEQGVIVRVEQVKAFKRISVDQSGVDLRLIASGSGSRVHIKMFEGTDTSNPILLADFVFDSQYPHQGASPQINVNGTGPANLKERSQLYSPPNMFHGPRMQSVLSLDLVGQKCIAGQASAHEATGWMPHLPTCRFLLHPLLLDNASQFVLFYLYEKQMPAIALLPFFIESIEFFSPALELPPVVSGRASLLSISDKATEARVEVVDSNNRVWMRVNSINSKRVMPSAELVEYINDPVGSFLSNRLTVHPELDGRCVLTELRTGLLPDDEAVLDWCLDYFLTRRERTFWRENLKFEKRKNDWLHGRIAAKEAIRMLVRERLNLLIGPLDIDITNDEESRPQAFISGGIDSVLISISHTTGIALALASFKSDGLPGVDAELITAHEPDFAARFLKTEELDYLAKCAPALRDAELTRLWSAKETVYKSLGGSLEMTSFDVDVSTLTNNAIALKNNASTTKFRVYSEVNGDHVRSYTLS